MIISSQHYYVAMRELDCGKLLSLTVICHSFMTLLANSYFLNVPMDDLSIYSYNATTFLNSTLTWTIYLQQVSV